MQTLFRRSAFSEAATKRIHEQAQDRLKTKILRFVTETCYYIDENSGDGNESGSEVLQWVLSETFDKKSLSTQTFLSDLPVRFEVGTRPNVRTAWGTTALSGFRDCGVRNIKRIEKSVRFGLEGVKPEQADLFLNPLYDPMTQMRFEKPIQTFDSGLAIEPVRIVPLLEEGIEALRRLNNDLGLAMDDQDLQIWFDLFVKELQRNPTDVEVVQVGASNAEHSRHGFWKAFLVIDGVLMPHSLMDLVQAPWKRKRGNALLAFEDNSSAIQGYKVWQLVAGKPGQTSSFTLRLNMSNFTFTIETHNHPTGVEPFNGGGTGTGGRERDTVATGRGAYIGVAGDAYGIDHLHIPGYNLPWENDGWKHPSNLKEPTVILVRGSDGTSACGNEFGEANVYGFCRTCGLIMPNGERRGWFKPLLVAAGAGEISESQMKKGEPEKGMLLVALGGDNQRVGVFGGPASSKASGDNKAGLDFASVQRLDAQMGQRGYRVIKTCADLGEKNPIVSVHDKGAVGNCSADTEIANPAGVWIKLSAYPLGDYSLSVVEIWVNESQDRYAILVRPEGYETLKAIADREQVLCPIVGHITGDGMLILHNDQDGTKPLCLPLDKILGSLPRKTYKLERVPQKLVPLDLPKGKTVRQYLDRVFRLLSVGSKRWRTTKVDHSVSGLVAGMQYDGPNMLSICDFAIKAQGYFGKTGVALSLGEQPIIGLISTPAMARMSTAEALLNMVGALITKLEDIKCHANWMGPAKYPGEGAVLYDAAVAVSNMLIEIGIAIVAGKDSLSMAAKAIAPDGSTQVVKAPWELVISAYAPMDNITKRVTPSFKKAGSEIMLIDLSFGRNRLGGSAAAQVHSQVGNECPDVDDVNLLMRGFNAVQELVKKGLITAIHDRSDGGLITTILEMAFAGNLGFQVNVNSSTDAISTLFAEELGLVVEYDSKNTEQINTILGKYNVPGRYIGITLPVKDGDAKVQVSVNGEMVLDDSMLKLRQLWEETSKQIDRLQANPECVQAESVAISKLITAPPYRFDFEKWRNVWMPSMQELGALQNKTKVAVIRATGSNGDKEMTAALFMAGFDPYDVAMTDLINGKVDLSIFRGIVFVGGFADADVFGSAKLWAARIRFNKKLAQQFREFYERPDTFSFGVCNGFQLSTLLGWTPLAGLPDEKLPRLMPNLSERFESRFSSVLIMPDTNAIMLQGLQNSILGVWVAHGEGRIYFPDEEIFQKVLGSGLAPIRYVNEIGMPTEAYPFNMNGSPCGIAGLCSPDGRHLGMMPHPERCFLPWQWPYWPKDWPKTTVSPWIFFFINARRWCEQTKQYSMVA